MHPRVSQPAEEDPRAALSREVVEGGGHVEIEPHLYDLALAVADRRAPRSELLAAGGILRITDAQYDLAHQAMQAELAGRAATPDAVTAEPPEQAPTTEARPFIPAEYYLTPDDFEAGRQLNHLAEQTTTGRNGPSFLFGKYDAGWVTGLQDPYDNEYMTLVVADDGQFQVGDYESKIPDFVFASAINQTLSKDVTSDIRNRAFLITYPSPTDPTQLVCSYTTWQDSRFFRNPKLSPLPVIMAFDFKIPQAGCEQFGETIIDKPHALEAMLLTSPYAPLLRSINPDAQVVRLMADELVWLNLPSGKPESASAHRTIARSVIDGTAGIRFALTPPIGETQITL